MARTKWSADPDNINRRSSIEKLSTPLLFGYEESENNCEAQKCEFFEKQIELMVYVIGASSLRRAVGKAPTTLRKHIQGKVCAVPGISWHHTAKNPEKQLQHFLETSLRNRSNIVIRNDLLNISLSPHKCIGNRRSIPGKILEILELFRKQVSALVYNQRIGTPFIQILLITARFLRIDHKQQLLPNRK